jgi:hypothetical protein
LWELGAQRELIDYQERNIAEVGKVASSALKIRLAKSAGVSKVARSAAGDKLNRSALICRMAISAAVSKEQAVRC